MTTSGERLIVDFSPIGVEIGTQNLQSIGKMGTPDPRVTLTWGKKNCCIAYMYMQ